MEDEQSRTELPACKAEVPLQTLRNYLYDLRFGSLLSPALVRHLESGCPTCDDRIEFLKATDPVLLQDEKAALDKLFDEIRVHTVREDEEYKRYASEVQALIGAEPGQARDADAVAGLNATLSARLTERVANMVREGGGQAAPCLLASRQVLAHLDEVRRVENAAERQRLKLEANSKYGAIFHSLPELQQRRIEHSFFDHDRVSFGLDTEQGFFALVFAAYYFTNLVVEWPEAFAVAGNELTLEAGILLRRTLRARAGAA
jgi:hypothetical protein